MIAKKIISHPLALLYAPGRNVEIVADEVSDLFISVSDYKNDMFNEGIENGIIYNGKKYDIFPQIDGGDAGSISITAKNSIHGNNILLAHGKKGGIISISTPPSSAMKIFATVEGKKQYRCKTTGTPIEECLSFDVDYDSFDDLSGQIIWSKR